MTIQNNNTAPFLPASIVLPKDFEELLIRLTLYFNDIAYRLNAREIGWYDLMELTTGQTWFTDVPQPSITQNTRRPAFRKTFFFPVVAGTATTSQPHGLGNVSTFTFTHIYGTLNLQATPLFCAIPQGAPDDVEITVDAVNVNIITTTNTYNGSTGIVVLEYLKN